MFERKTRKNPGRRAVDSLPVFDNHPRQLDALLLGVWLGVVLCFFYLRGDK